MRNARHGRNEMTRTLAAIWEELVVEEDIANLASLPLSPLLLPVCGKSAYKES